jgi:pyrimidine-specific ribonucleoside hydrolase
MRKVLILVTLVLAVSILKIDAHSGKPSYYVIIDTDCAIDDLRAITLLLASTKVAVLGITTSDGTLNPYEGRKKVESLLRSYYHEGIPVAAGDIVVEEPPAWRDMNRRVLWGDEEAADTSNEDIAAADFIIESVAGQENRITVICLGGLTNIARALDGDSSIKQKIERIIWFNRTPDIEDGTNYMFDKKSAEYILNSGINIDIVSGPGNEVLHIDSVLADSISRINSVYAQKIHNVLQQDELKNSAHKGYLNMWDDLIPLYLLSSEAFAVDSLPGNGYTRFVSPSDISLIRSKVIQILDVNEYVTSKIFSGFPDDPALFQDDVAAVMNEIINRYGLEEWKVGVLANELHGHLGIYATVGVKMGLRAREFFNIGIDDINIISYAGREPPVSCMNDGLQVSTGGTLGHGLIYLADDDKTRPMALFAYMDRTVIIRLKDEYINIARNDVKNCINEYGNLTKDYWSCVRRHAIQYWMEWDKHDMFELEY